MKGSLQILEGGTNMPGTHRSALLQANDKHANEYKERNAEIIAEVLEDLVFDLETALDLSGDTRSIPEGRDALQSIIESLT